MQALVTKPGTENSTRVEEVPAPKRDESRLLLRMLEVGVCGTDREIVHGEFGVAPADGDELVLGHESLAIVERDGHGFSRGDLVTATVRRSCEHCLACFEGAPDSCLTGDYVERGITRLDGFARELVLEDPEQVIGIPRELGRLGVLAEPASVCARALRHVRAIGERQPWRPEHALVIGAGAVGLLTTFLLRLEGIEVWTTSREGPTDPRAGLVAASGARYVSGEETTLAQLREATGGFDVVVEAAGDVHLMADSLGLLRRSGVACILGIDGRGEPASIPGRVLGIDTILENRVLFGSVNARRTDWLAAVKGLLEARRRWPDALDSFIGLRAPLDAFEAALAYAGGKATLVIEDI